MHSTKKLTRCAQYNQLFCWHSKIPTEPLIHRELRCVLCVSVVNALRLLPQQVLLHEQHRRIELEVRVLLLGKAVAFVFGRQVLLRQQRQGGEGNKQYSDFAEQAFMQHQCDLTEIKVRNLYNDCRTKPSHNAVRCKVM